MRKLIMLLSLMTVALTASAEGYLFSYFMGNGDGLHFAYSRDGITWQNVQDGKIFLTPELGSRLMRDPSIVQGPDGTFHLVWTTGWTDKVIGYAHSRDLVNWSPQQEIPVMMHESEARNSWAPEIFYDAPSKKYYIVWATTIPGRHSHVEGSEREQGYNHRQYYVTTRDFKKFSKTKIFFNPDFSAIDASIFRFGDEYMMVVKNENPNPPEKNLRVTTTSNLRRGFPVEVSPPITGNYWAEGPAPLVVGDYIYVYFDKYREGKYGAVRSRDGRVWEDVSDIVSFPRGVRHGTAFAVSDETLERILNN